ncbi:MAG: c-type cytochrome [Panacagrimonas sp.]
MLAYLLNLAEIVPADYVLSERNMAEVQERMPNRNGMLRNHGLWDVKGKADTANTACMKDCAKGLVITSELPDHALNAHGNLADQNRSFGAVRGRVTDAKATQTKAGSAATGANAAVIATLNANGCLACHGMETKVIGPGFREIAVKHQSRVDAPAYLAQKIAKGGGGVWGQMPMPPQPQVSKPDLDAIAAWITGGAKP